jgi:uncharacterized membrane protein
MGMTWRDRLLVLNGVLFCILGVALLVRYALQQIAWLGGILGLAVLLYGGHRLYRVGKELRRRAAHPGGQ